MLVVERLASARSKKLGKEEDEMRLLYIVTKGMEDPTLASVPLHIAANRLPDIGRRSRLYSPGMLPTW